MKKDNLCGIPHIVADLPNDVDLAIINAAIDTAIKATLRFGGDIRALKLVKAEGTTNKNIQVKIEYHERKASESIKETV